MAKYMKKGKKGIKGDQWKLDRNRNGIVDQQDLKMMRKGKKGKKKGKKK